MRSAVRVGWLLRIDVYDRTALDRKMRPSIAMRSSITVDTAAPISITRTMPTTVTHTPTIVAAAGRM